MAKGKRKDRKKQKGSIFPTKAVLHREAKCAFKTIQSHPSVVGMTGFPRSLDNGGFEIGFDMDVSLPSRSRRTGITETGVKAQEPIILRFPLNYPFKAPTILLRSDFNSLLPHINPTLRVDGKGHVLPCVYDGPLDDLLHQESDGLSEILNQLSEWLGKAAIDDLIDPEQGWEPIRRDDTSGWIVYDLSEFRDLVQNKNGTLVFQCRVLEMNSGGKRSYFVGGINHHSPVDVSPSLIKRSFFVENGSPLPSYRSLLIFAWSNLGGIEGHYLPESISNFRSLFERAEEYGCDDSLKDAFLSIRWAIKQASLHIDHFQIFVILCARRPCDLIGDDSSLELIPYVVECQVEDAKSPFLESAIKIKEDSPVLPLGHRHLLTSKLLRRMSGGNDKVKNGPIILLGCGSVGSKIAMDLARSGHGPFKLIDMSAFSPHNVARHALIPVPEFPGQPKALLLAEELKLLRADAEPYIDDIISLFERPDSREAVFSRDTSLVVESTGSMPVRELLADLPPGKLPGKLLHAALYQSGKMGLMAIEGNGRNPNVSDLVIRFRDLGVDDQSIRERFQVSNPSMGRQEIGLGCGSDTMVMPDTRISLYAAGVAERARRLLEGNVNRKGELWIGTLEPNEIQVSWTHLELCRTRLLSVKAKNIWEVRILDKASEQITKELKKYDGIETGGVLIGRISLTRRCVTISRVIQAPPDSERSPISFILGTEGLRERVLEVNDKSGGYLTYVGTWHSHPKGGEPSALDRASLEQMKRLRFGAPALSLIWVPSGFNAIIDEGKLS